MLRARLGRKGFAQRYARVHRHGSVELVVNLGLDSFHLGLVAQPLGIRVGGRHLVQRHHLLLLEGDGDPRGTRRDELTPGAVQPQRPRLNLKLELHEAQFYQ